VITGVKFRGGLDVVEVDLDAARFRGQNTTLGCNSECEGATF
jgi:hypothetical protein